MVFLPHTWNKVLNVGSSVPPVAENTVSQLQQCSTEHQPQRDAHNTDQHVGVLLQAGAQSQTEGQLQQQGCQVPQPPLHALVAVPWVKIRLAATCHLHYQHEDEDGVKSPNRKEDEKPVPVDFGVQLEDQHDEKDQGKYPGEEDTLSQGHLHLWKDDGLEPESPKEEARDHSDHQVT